MSCLRNHSLMTFILMMILVSWESCLAGAMGANDSSAVREVRRVYKTVNNTDLTLHIFFLKEHHVSDLTTAIVFFYGGGWTGGTPRQFYQQARYFSDRGVVAISAEYRVKNTHNTTPFESVKDAKSAVRWVREHAKELGVNPDKIVASGGSAGGHVAACTGIIDGYEEEGEDEAISSVPSAMILFNPVLDTTEKGYGLDKVGEESKTDISPNHHIREGIVPTIIFHGMADETVPFENAERFTELMKASGNHCELEAYAGKGHGFFNGSFFRPHTADTMVYMDVMKKSTMFLASRGMLPRMVGESEMEESPSHEVFSTLKAANIFSDYMVLQREQPVPIWGTAYPNEKVTVAFAGQSKTTEADKNGKWMLQLDPMQASTEGRDMIISGKSDIIFSDILVGEVWICSGQSNMQFPVGAVPEVRGLIPFKNNIRAFEVQRTVSLQEKEDLEGKWENAHPSSAVAFSFAFFLETAGNIPIGIIHSSWGSSSIEAWMPRDMKERLPHFKTIMEEFDADTATQNRIESILALPDGWSRQDDIFLRRQPNILYNAIMKPLAPYASRGLVWYQGERNTRYLSGMPEVTQENWFHRVAGMKEYGEILKEWILRYRQEWQNDDMNFMIVMLPGFGRGTADHLEIDPEDPAAASWAWMRESQLQVLDLPNTAVANTIDLGDVKDIHPKDKLPIGQRLALLAAKNTLDQDILATGPMMKKVEAKENELIVHFTNADGLKTTDGKAPSAFWVTDESGEWKLANAKIAGEKIILSTTEIKNPLYVRYAFAGKPKVNLVNSIELPAYPFRTDTFQK